MGSLALAKYLHRKFSTGLRTPKGTKGPTPENRTLHALRVNPAATPLTTTQARPLTRDPPSTGPGGQD